MRSFGSAERNAANPYSGLIEADDGALYGTTLQGGSAGRGTVYKVNKDGSGYVIIRSFSGTGGDGSRPQASLIQGSDGALYGTTGNGGNAEDYTGAGTIFKISKDGTAYGILHKFGSVTNDGRSASGGLIEGTDGYLYGTTDTGGFSDSVFPPGYGTVFKIKKDGTGYGVVHQFIPSGGDGQRPYCSLLEASDGTLYGSTAQGGDAGPWYGTVFKLNKDGSGHTILHSFGVSAGDGTSPTGGLIEGSDGVLYGTTSGGGSSGGGSIYKINRDGTGYSQLRSLGDVANDGRNPRASLIEGPDGLLYGTTSAGGGADGGTVFRINRDGSGYIVLLRFNSQGSPGPVGINPVAPLWFGSDGALYGTTLGDYNSSDRGTVFGVGKDGASYRVVVKFSPSGLDGSSPAAELIEGTDSMLYGTTSSGGSANLGTIFKIARDGNGYAVMHSLGGADTGSSPAGPLFEASDGRLYGTTSSGGVSNVGTIFTINREGGGYSVLHSFTAVGPDGSNPSAGLIEGSDGFLYGTTESAGYYDVEFHFRYTGTIFRIAKDGTLYQVLRTLKFLDGNRPWGLLEAPDGFLYGTTAAGGPAEPVAGAGVIFRISTTGQDFQIIGTAGLCGLEPQSGLTFGSDGALYGTSRFIEGRVFRIGRDATACSVVHRFGDLFDEAAKFNGFQPQAAVIEGFDGALYGTADGGFTNGTAGYSGLIFKVAKNGSDFAVIHRLAPDGSEGVQLRARLLRGRDGAYYGITFAGGEFGKGTIFRLKSAVAPTPMAIGTRLEGTNCLIQWPVTSTQDSLEDSIALGPNEGAWTPFTGAVSRRGNTYTAVVPTDRVSKFLRVRRN